MLDRLIYGGSFDPPHRGHAAMARHVLETGVARNLDIVPAAVSPYKTHAPPVAPEIRLEMLRAALEAGFAESGDKGDGSDLASRTRILELELNRAGPSYTAETCRALREEHPGEKIGLLMGTDSFRGLGGWKLVDEILSHHEIVIFRRGEADAADLLEEQSARFPEARFRVLDNPLVDCSSSELRERISLGGVDAADHGDCLAEAVRELIRRHGLYQ